MTDVTKGGAPDLWWDNRLVEMKRGSDRLSQRQRAWHARYYRVHRVYPLVVFCSKKAGHYCIFQNYIEFDLFRDGWSPKVAEHLPELDALYKAEYGAKGYKYLSKKERLGNG